MIRRLMPVLLTGLFLPSLSAAAPTARLYLVERIPGGVTLREDSVAAGSVAVFPVNPDSGLIDLVLPVGPGQSASLLRPGDRGMIVVRHRGDALQVSIRRPDGSMQERPTRAFSDLAREETRVSVTGGDGSRAAFVIRGGTEAWPDTVGPVANMFAGKLPFELADGDWIVQTETWRRPLLRAPRGFMRLTRDRYLTVEALRPDGGRGRFILDLGAGESIVNAGFVPEGQAITPSGMVEYSSRGQRVLDYQAGGATGKAPVAQGHTVFPALSLGGLSVDSLEAQVTDLPEGLGEGIVGLLGIDVLRRASRVRLTVPANAGAAATLEFDPPAPLAEEHGRTGFSWVSSHVVLPGDVAGHAARWILDSGAPVSFLDSAALADEPWVVAAAAAAPVHGAGGQQRPSFETAAPSLRVGSGTGWRDVPVRLASLDPFDPLRADGRVPALLGVAELARMGSLELDFGAHVARWGRSSK